MRDRDTSDQEEPAAPKGHSFAVVLDPQEELKQRPPAPLWAWILLVAAVTAVSSAGVVFARLVDVPPITLAAWRLQLTSVFLGIGAAFSWQAMCPDDRQRTLRQAGLLSASGTCLAFHFGLWVYSVEATSLTHSLLFVSATPLFLAGGTWLLRQPISAGELAGTAVGGAGAVVLATAAARSDAQVTLRGDMAALAASLCFVGYLLIGRRLRAWMPVMVYAFSVTGLAAAQLTAGSLLFEGASLAAAGKHGALGWAASSHYLPFVLYLGIVPGIVGHTGFNTLLRYLDPLLISLACNLEPLIGSLLGWAAGVVSAPGAWTYVGGALVMASTFAVSLASHLRERRAKEEEQARGWQAASTEDAEEGEMEEDGTAGYCGNGSREDDEDEIARRRLMPAGAGGPAGGSSRSSNPGWPGASSSSPGQPGPGSGGRAGRDLGLGGEELGLAPTAVAGGGGRGGGEGGLAAAAAGRAGGREEAAAAAAAGDSGWGGRAEGERGGF